MSASLDLPDARLGARPAERRRGRARTTSSSAGCGPGRQSVGSDRGVVRATSTTRSSPCVARRRPRPSGEAYRFQPRLLGQLPRRGRGRRVRHRPGSGSGSARRPSPGRSSPAQPFATPEAVLVYSDAGLGGDERRVPRALSRAARPRGRGATRRGRSCINNWEGDLLRLRRGEAARDRDGGARPRRRAVRARRRLVRRARLGRLVARRLVRRPAQAARRARRPRAGGRGARPRASGCGSSPRWSAERSRLFEAHPDWAIGVPGRPRTESRQQLVLDMSRPEIVDHLFGVLSEVLSSAPISYVKWDMNRTITEPYSAGLAARPPGRVLPPLHPRRLRPVRPADDGLPGRSCSSRAPAAAAGSTRACSRSRRRPGRATTPMRSSACGSSGGPRWSTR